MARIARSVGKGRKKSRRIVRGNGPYEEGGQVRIGEGYETRRQGQGGLAAPVAFP